MSDHVVLAPSSAHRWMRCPGSVAAEQGYPRETSVYAAEGTVAHRILAMCLNQKKDAIEFIGTSYEEDGTTITVDAEMCSAVQACYNVVRPIMEDAEHYGVEAKVDLDPIQPPGPMRGTVDFWAFRGGSLFVVDFKYGKGVRVFAANNPQLRYYAMGVWTHLATTYGLKQNDIASVYLVIVQPRVLDDTETCVDMEEVSLDTIRDWVRTELFPAAERALDPQAPRFAGPHCRFCRARADCATLRHVALATAELEFDTLASETVSDRLPAPTLLTPEQIGYILTTAPLLEDWLVAVRARAEQMLEHGEVIPGWSRRPKRAVRKWKDEQQVRQWAKEHGLEDAIEEKRLLSPAQVEKRIGKALLPTDLVVAETSGYVLCRADDARALPAGVTEFTTVEREEI